MPLFRNSNKSQASLDRHTDSRDRSPVQNESAYSQAQVYGGSQPASQHPQHQDTVIEERYYRDKPPTSTTLTAQHQHRGSTTRAPTLAVDAYARDPLHQQQPTVNVVHPLSPSAALHKAHQPSGPPNNIVQAPPVRIEQPKRSKRAFFGLGGSKEKKDEKEHAGVGRSVNRTSSVLKKTNHHPQQPPTPSTSQSPQSTNAGQFSPAEPPRSLPYAQDSPAEPSTDDPERYEEYYTRQSQLEGPADPDTRQTIRYVANAVQYDEPITPRHNKQLSLQSQRADYPAYHQNLSANNSSTYLPHPQAQNAALNPLRPPSQQSLSLGPPSPLGGPHSDSRPPTAGAQGRYTSSTSQQQPSELSHQRQESQDHQRQDPDESNMGRNDGSNGNMRQHRDDERHPVYQIRNQGHDQGRNTPPPAGREDLSNMDAAQLLQKHQELLAKYSKVKRYYFEREDQIKTLQNTVASQRLSLSKTSLDDNQYATKFDRLNGAIQNLSFNHRKEWRRIPNWLAPVCNRDACQIGTKEMTAVGRACITKWVFDKIFERVFHPGIDQNLSLHLKAIERSLRRAQYGTHLTAEQQDDLMAKIMTWRLTTMEGLSDVLNSRQAEMYTESLTHLLTRELNSYLQGFLIDTPSPGLLDSLSGIISQALSICSNIPLESRDVCVEYYPPAHHVNEAYMKIESGMTPLQNPGSAPSMVDHVPGYTGHNEEDEPSATSSHDPSSMAELEAQIREATDKGATTNSAGAGNLGPRKDSATASMKSQSIISPQAQQQGKVDSKSKSLFGSFGGKRPTPSSNNATSGLPSQKQFDQQSLAASESGRSDAGNGDAYNIRTLTGDSTEGKIRFAVFLAVEVKGRSVLTVKDDKNDKKDGEKGAESAGVGHSAADGKSADKSGINILYKAPVYVFDA